MAGSPRPAKHPWLAPTGLKVHCDEESDIYNFPEDNAGVALPPARRQIPDAFPGRGTVTVPATDCATTGLTGVATGCGSDSMHPQDGRLRSARAELMTTSFEDMEPAIRDQPGRALGPGLAGKPSPEVSRGIDGEGP